MKGREIKLRMKMPPMMIFCTSFFCRRMNCVEKIYAVMTAGTINLACWEEKNQNIYNSSIMAVYTESFLSFMVENEQIANMKIIRNCHPKQPSKVFELNARANGAEKNMVKLFKPNLALPI